VGVRRNLVDALEGKYCSKKCELRQQVGTKSHTEEEPPPEAPVAAIRPWASASVVQVTLVPGELTKGKARHLNCLSMARKGGSVIGLTQYPHHN